MCRSPQHVTRAWKALQGLRSTPVVYAHGVRRPGVPAGTLQHAGALVGRGGHLGSGITCHTDGGVHLLWGGLSTGLQGWDSAASVAGFDAAHATRTQHSNSTSGCKTGGPFGPFQLRPEAVWMQLDGCTLGKGYRAAAAECVGEWPPEPCWTYRKPKPSSLEHGFWNNPSLESFQQHMIGLQAAAKGAWTHDGGTHAPVPARATFAADTAHSLVKAKLSKAGTLVMQLSTLKLDPGHF